MTTLLIQNAHTIATQDNARTELRHGSILIRDNSIAFIGPTAELPATHGRMTQQARRS